MIGSVLIVTGLFGLVVAGCGGDDDGGSSTPVIDPGDGGSYAPNVDPANFVSRIDNPYLPWVPGSKWVYESDDGSERTEVEVLAETRQVMGIATTVVRDTVYEDGEVVEDTYDWYAQDKDGNVWYMGEDSTDYEDGKAVKSEGSWEAGVDGALPGIVMQAEPEADQAYRQEYYPDHAEDMAQIVALGVPESVPYRQFDDLLQIREWTPLEPDVIEDKYYAKGIGVVLENAIQGEEGRTELVSFTPGQ